MDSFKGSFVEDYLLLIILVDGDRLEKSKSVEKNEFIIFENRIELSGSLGQFS